jgi:uncharacterized protein (UPF0332 family)
MDQTEQNRRWETAQEHHNAAQHLLTQGLCKASVSRSYYACFQAMWVAAGDPNLGYWKHAGLMQTFCFGKWATSPFLPTALATVYKKLLALYDLRLDADYRALPVDQAKAQEAVDLTIQIFDLITQHKTI